MYILCVYMYTHIYVCISILYCTPNCSAPQSRHRHTSPKNDLKATATHFNTLQHAATHCNTLQHTHLHHTRLQSCQSPYSHTKSSHPSALQVRDFRFHPHLLRPWNWLCHDSSSGTTWLIPMSLLCLPSGNYACIYMSFNIKRHINK